MINDGLTRFCGRTRLGDDDPGRAIDRTLGGVVRAAFRPAEFCPDPVLDPVAWQSFQKATHDNSFVCDIYFGYSLSDAEGNEVKIRPRLYADFNGIEQFENDVYLLLDGRGTKDDMERLRLEFEDGLEALFYENDAEDDGTRNDVQVVGVMKYDPNYKWVAVVRIEDIHHASDERMKQ